jgi:hypothetical protein
MAVVNSGAALQADPFNIDAPVQGAIALTAAGPSVAPGRAFVVNATAAGNVTITFADGSSHVIAAPVGYSVYPYAVTDVTASTATATYANLK